MNLIVWRAAELRLSGEANCIELDIILMQDPSLWGSVCARFADLVLVLGVFAPILEVSY